MTGYSADEAEDESAQPNCSGFHFLAPSCVATDDCTRIDTENGQMGLAVDNRG
jgi:hypothetical protein